MNRAIPAKAGNIGETCLTGRRRGLLLCSVPLQPHSLICCMVSASQRELLANANKTAIDALKASENALAETRRSVDAYIAAERGYLRMRDVSSPVEHFDGLAIPKKVINHYAVQNVGRTPVVIKFIRTAGACLSSIDGIDFEEFTRRIRREPWLNQTSTFLPAGESIGTEGTASSPVGFAPTEWTLDQIQSYFSNGQPYAFLVIIGYETIHGQRRRFASVAVRRSGIERMEVLAAGSNPFDEAEPE